MNDIILSTQNGEPVVSSRQIAESFGKEHKHVLDAVKNLVAENSAAKSMFHPATFENRGKQYPMYLMNRDGFSLLAFGFTGKEAFEWKLKYIQAFNAMEKQLMNQKQAVLDGLSPQLRYLINLEQQQNQQAKQLAQVNERLDAACEALSLNVGVDWEKRCQSVIKGIAFKRGGSSQDYEDVWNEIYDAIPFGNHYEYSPSYNDFGHNPNDDEFFKQMDFLTPELLRTLKPGRVAAIHVKDRVEFANVTGLAAPTIEPFHADCIAHFRKHGFAYFGMITVVTDVVRENNQTYRLGWTEQCKDGTKMGVGCPEYILLFRKLPTDRSRGYADIPVKKSKEEYTRAQWQIDAHAFWRSSGDRPFAREDLEKIPTSKLQSVYRKFSRDSVYDYGEHVKLAESLDKDGRLPSTFMVVAPGSWDMTVWDDIVRMKTLNTSQSQRRQNLHVCPLQIDIVQRLIERYSNEGELVADPFAGLFTVPYEAVKMNRKGKGVELNPDYFRDGVGYLESADAEKDAPTLFDLLENGA